MHRLNGFPGCWVKRDDEIGGSKTRKYLSLVPALRESGIRQCLLQGGPGSNNLQLLPRLLRDAGIRPVYFQPLRARPAPPQLEWLRSFLGSDFHQVALAELEQAQADYLRLHPDCRLLAEGASEPEALAGALTLAEEIPDHPQVFVDSGTGMIAAALLLGLGRQGRSPQVVVVDLTGAFPEALQRWCAGQALPPFQVVRPRPGASFGSRPAAVRLEIERVQSEEGIACEPVYSGKLFMMARRLARPGALLIHSGQSPWAGGAAGGAGGGATGTSTGAGGGGSSTC